MKTISIWGSTGVIGSKALAIATKSGFEVVSIVGNSNHEKLIEQGLALKPRYIGVADVTSFKIVKEAFDSTEIEVLPESEFENLAQLNVDCCVMAISGKAGLRPTFSCLGHAKRLAIATKEAIIAGGKLLQTLASQLGTTIIPIDSEHNSIFQCLQGEDPKSIRKLVLTASGGPFLDLDESELMNVTVEDALKHPNWNMGKKNTIDSATMINKALEIIEAAYLFDIDISKIESIIHPNSIIHGMVEFSDNSIKALMAAPDMNMPISYAINYPHRVDCELPRLNLGAIGSLKFERPKNWQLRNINLAYQAFNENKVIAFNTANEEAVSLFLNHKINFCEIYKFIQNTLETAQKEVCTSIDDIINVIKESTKSVDDLF